jgi:hypothetical protein
MSQRSRLTPWWGARKTHVPPEGSFVSGDPEYLGKMPMRTELEVLPEENPPGKARGWWVTCFDGSEVFKLDVPDVPLTRREDIQPGDKLRVLTLVGTYEMTATVRDGKLWGESEGTIAALDFNTDSRHCWVSRYAINKRALEKVQRA